MIDRLGHAPEEQPDAHAGAEEHREPRAASELRLFIRLPQLDVTSLAEREHDREHQEPRHRRHIEPAEPIADPVAQVHKGALHLLAREQKGAEHKPDDDQRPEREHDRVHLEVPSQADAPQLDARVVAAGAHASTGFWNRNTPHASHPDLPPSTHRVRPSFMR